MRNTKKTHLIVQVIQNGSLQFEKVFSKPILSKRLKIGSKKQDGIWIPFCLFHKSVELFSLNRKSFSIYIDPRFDGFLTTPDGFGRVSDIVTPKGSLTALASPTEPKVVPLPVGSRGGIKLYGYEVIFKVETYKKPYGYKTKTKGLGVPRQLFPWPETNTSIEKAAPLLGVISMAALFFPILLWTLKAPVHKFGPLESYPYPLLAQFIAPDHFRYLPAIYGSEYEQKSAPLQAYWWVKALQERWKFPEGNLSLKSGGGKTGFSLIDGFRAPEGPPASSHNFGILTRKIWEIGKNQKPKYLMTLPLLLTHHSGGDAGTLLFRQHNKLERLKTTYIALKSQILTQHEFLKDHLLKQNAKINDLFGLPEPVTPPTLGQEPAEIDGEFLQERLRFQDGESWAKYAQNKGMYRNLWANSGKKDPIQKSSLHLNPSLGILPFQQMTLGGGPPNTFGALEYNLEFSTGSRKLPPPPKPSPFINMQEVALVLFGKREQLRMCYELSLRRNPRMTGDVQMGWTVRLDGRVANIKPLRTQIRDGLFLKCLEQRLESWRFPKPVNGPVYLKHTFGFVSKNGADQDFKD